MLDPWQIRAGGGTIDDAKKSAARGSSPSIYPMLRPTCRRQNSPRSSGLLPGETGTIDSAAVLTELAEWGYDGPVTPRADRSRVAGMRREQVVKLAGQRLDEAWKAAGLTPPAN